MITEFCLLAGSGIVFIAGIGLNRLPDPLAKAHAFSKVVTLGGSLLLLALYFQTPHLTARLKVVASIFFNFLTIPLASHIFGLYAYRLGDKPVGEGENKSRH